ncbi:MAG: response regulator transcription factor [Lachnospiraceae bacterium]|nr:response regulator transcription factor [Lachnospiraceae bacterium]
MAKRAKVDGITILKEVRKQDKDIKLIMLTAKGELEDRLLGFENGANDYVPKPFHIDELAARVNAQLNIAKAVENMLEFGDIVLDYRASKVRCIKNSEDVGVNNKEFQLLEYLMSNPDRILSREMIYDRIWGMDSEAVSNNLEAQMMGLNSCATWMFWKTKEGYGSPGRENVRAGSINRKAGE